MRTWIVSRPIKGRTTGTVAARTRAEALRIANGGGLDQIEGCDFSVYPCGKWVVDCEDEPGPRPISTARTGEDKEQA